MEAFAWAKRPNWKNYLGVLLPVLVLCSLLSPTAQVWVSGQSRSLPLEADAIEIQIQENHETLVGDADTLILLNLNQVANPWYGVDENGSAHNGSYLVSRSTLGSAYYIERLPSKGKLYQAYRQTACEALWPSSCTVCCESKYTLPDASTTCCAPQSDQGERLFGIGDEITVSGSRVLILESGFVWYRPPELVHGHPYDELTIRAEFWRVSKPPLSPTTPTDSGCANDRKLCAAGQSDRCRCSASVGNLTAKIGVNDVRRWPQVGFGGYMIAFDGGDDFFSTKIKKFPQYEFTLQLWFQQNRRRPSQTLLTFWSDVQGRVLEIADTSNFQFYHLNNRSQPSGVGVNDGEWHHLAFVWRLICTEASRIKGATYCVNEEFGRKGCLIDEACLRVDITIIVDGVQRAVVSLPPFLPPTTGTLVWGQRMLKPLTTSEVDMKNALHAKLQAGAKDETSSLPEPYTDNNLQLIFNKLRVGMTEDEIFGNSVSSEAFRGPFTETQPWRDPYSKYCSLTLGGGYDPWTALSGNIDEVRLYSYAKHPDDVALDMHWVINGDSGISFSRAVSNYSLILYYSFDMDSVKYKLQQGDDISKWPLDIEDMSPSDGTPPCFECQAMLGGGTFMYAPLQVPSTAPIFGARAIQLVITDQRDPVPIDLIDSVRHLVPNTLLYTRIDKMPLYGDLMVGMDDCDYILNVDQFSGIQPMELPFCKGGLVGLKLLGTSGEFTSGCSIGDIMSASDGSGSGFKANVTELDAGGVIISFSFLSFGKGYDWTLSHPTNLTISNPLCMCGTISGAVPGAMNRCFTPLISAGKADTTGDPFTGIDMDLGFPITYTVSCSQGLCPTKKPRPCKYACHRSVGWMTDQKVVTKDQNRQMVGPYGEIVNRGSLPSVQWSNSRHTAWYFPLHIRENPYFVKNDDDVLVLQDTIKDEFMVRYWDYLPVNPVLEDPDNLPPMVHMWVQIILERLALPVNSSFIGEESSAIITQLQVLDFDRGTAQYNAPFTVHVDPPLRGRLYQAVQINRNDTRYPYKCVCWTSPRFPVSNYTPENLDDPPEIEIPLYRRCDITQIGDFCMIRGKAIIANDTLVQDFHDARLLPGFQHSRDGFHVIYELGESLRGLDRFYWRLKHPQGQIESAHVDIQIRGSNKGPIAFNTSFVTTEDQIKVVALEGSDMDDVLKPIFYVTRSPTNGYLYQCVTLPGGGCGLGQKLARQNESIIDWATVDVDPEGALDGVNRQVYVLEEAFRAVPPVLNITNVGTTPTTLLGAGYGYGTWNFETPAPVATRNGGGFRQMCGVRGSLAATLTLKSPMYVTGVDIFYVIRFDTPYRILAKKSLAARNATYDYNIDAAAIRKTLKPLNLDVAQVGILTQELGARETLFGAGGKLITSKTFTAEAMTCDLSESVTTACRRLWDGSRWVMGEIHEALTFETQDEWLELYRGVPIQSSYGMPGEGVVSPIFPPSLVWSSELRIETCGQLGRVFNDPPPPTFIGALRTVRVKGTRTNRPVGLVTDPAKRVVYVPNPDFSGSDSFEFRVRDLSGGSRQSDWRFSRKQGWSQIAYVGITVTPKADVPLGTNSIASSPPADGVGSVLVPVRGSHPGDGVTAASAFDIFIENRPSSGQLLTFTGVVAPNIIPADTSGFVRYRPPINSCGFRYASFQYRLREIGGGQFSEIYSGVVDVRCAGGQECSDVRSCVDCPTGQFGHNSGIKDLCKLCPAGTYQSKRGQTSCVSCSPGTFTDRPGQQSCRKCPSGTASLVSGATFCPSCTGGSYAAKSGSTSCIECGILSHTFGKGAYTCKDCPTNTRAIVARAPNQTYCVCKAGTYDVKGRTGLACKTCPPGAFCFGGKLLPVPKTGYWTSRSLWTNDTAGGQKGRPVSNTTAATGDAFFAPCNYRYIRGVCIGYPDIDVQARELQCIYRNSEIVQGPRTLDALTSKGLDVVIKNCTVNDPRVGEEPEQYLRPRQSTASYEDNGYCSEAYAGRLCSTCAPGYRKFLQGYCDKCSFLFEWHWIFGTSYFVSGIGAFLVIWAMMFFFCAFPARSMYILITHLQLLAVLGRFSVPWPAITQQMLNGLSFLNLSLDAFHWNCMGFSLEPYWQRWAAEFIISPAILFTCYVYHYVVVRDETEVAAASALRARMMAAREEAEHARHKQEHLEAKVDHGDSREDEAAPDSIDDLREEESETSSMMDIFVQGYGPGGVILATGDRDHREPLTQSELMKLQDRSLWLMIMLYHILFVQALSVATIPFSCSQIAEGVSVLDWWPNFECDVGVLSLMRYAAFGYCATILIILPSLLCYVLYKSWANELVTDPVYLQRFGWLFEAYEHKYCWWEILGLLRRAVLVGCQGVLSHHGNTQLLIAIPYLAAHLSTTAYFCPHVKPRHNFTDLWLQAQLLLLACYGLTNVVGNEGMIIFTRESGESNQNLRINTLPSAPSMDAIADKNINSLWFSNLMYIMVAGFSMGIAFLMVVFDLYEMKVSAPFWAPMALNYITGLPLFVWDEYVSRFLSMVDLAMTRIRDRNKPAPPARPSSRWAHRVMNDQSFPQAEQFFAGKSVQDILEDVIGNTLEHEWARSAESVRGYIRSIDKRVFAAEMYNSKSSNLPNLERERNKAKKLLLSFMRDESKSIFKALYDQTGTVEQLVWDMQELERMQTHARIVKAGQEENERLLEHERDEQIRRVGDIDRWKAEYDAEKKHCEELAKHVKQARDALVLYNLEESASSEDEKELDEYLQKQITEYIESKTARKLMEEGKLDPMMHLS